LQKEPAMKKNSKKSEKSRKDETARKALQARSRKIKLTVGIDLGDEWSQCCCLDESGEVVEEFRVKTTREALRARFKELKPMVIALEVGTHSRWVSQLLQEWGHEVIVANARELRAITGSDRKSDRVDAEKLARYARVDRRILRPIRHRGTAAQEDLLVIRGRAVLVKTRTQLVNAVRGMVKSFGYRLPGCKAERFARLKEKVPAALQPALNPLMETLEQVQQQIERYDEQIEKLATEKYPESKLLRQPWGVGLITSVSYVLTLEDKNRFEKSRDVGCYLGLRPRRSQSSQRDPELRITKGGDSYVRSLLVECGQRILSEKGPDSALKRFGQRLAARGKKNAYKRAVVAIARKLAILLHKLWVTGEVYEPFPGGADGKTVSAAA
jgi:transposase